MIFLARTITSDVDEYNKKRKMILVEIKLCDAMEYYNNTLNDWKKRTVNVSTLCLYQRQLFRLLFQQNEWTHLYLSVCVHDIIRCNVTPTELL